MKKLDICACILLSACELVVDVKVPMNPPKLTLNCAFTQDSVWHAEVFRSNYILDESGTYKEIVNAKLVLKENGVTIDTLQYEGFGKYSSSKEVVAKPNVQYEISGSAPGFESISAQSFLPPAGKISDAQFTLHPSDGTGQDFNYTIDVTFQDNPDTEDFYQFEVHIAGSWDDPQTGQHHDYEYPTYSFTDDPQLRNENIDDILFDDKTINGNEVKLRIKGQGFSAPDTKFIVVMRTLNKDLYEYTLTRQLQQFTSGDPFAQPVRVHNNITNGFGVFGGYQESKFTVNP